jgi:hypothetical protein
MDKSLQFPGVSNAWTMPIKARIDMLSTGIRTPLGVKVLGTDLGCRPDIRFVSSIADRSVLPLDGPDAGESRSRACVRDNVIPVPTGTSRGFGDRVR